MLDFWSDYTIQLVVLGSAMIGALSGALGCFAYLRKQSLVGDVVAHSSLLGIVLAFWFTYLLTGTASKSIGILLTGALVAGLASLFLTDLITSYTRIKPDAGLGIMLAIFFGTGIMLLRFLQRSQPAIPGINGIDDYLFGMAATMTSGDAWLIAIVGVAALVTMTLLWHRLKLFTFDADYASGLGMPIQMLEVVLLALIVIGIVVGLQIVGVVLMIGLLIAPAASARQWTRSMAAMCVTAACIGAASAAAGAVVSATGSGLPTGPVIVLILSAVFAFSLVVAPGRGLLHRRRKVVS
ncbi:MAG TPA: hypothetical protein DDW52_02965 [Planctomycetaceae bacterium]|nr:hypothetical protein [Planctomycetaceae bacterium]